MFSRTQRLARSTYTALAQYLKHCARFNPPCNPSHQSSARQVSFTIHATQSRYNTITIASNNLRRQRCYLLTSRHLITTLPKQPSRTRPVLSLIQSRKQPFTSSSSAPGTNHPTIPTPLASQTEAVLPTHPPADGPSPPDKNAIWAKLRKIWFRGGIASIYITAGIGICAYIGLRLKAGIFFRLVISDQGRLQDFIDQNQLTTRFPDAWAYNSVSEGLAVDNDSMSMIGMKNMLIYYQMMQLIPAAQNQCLELKQKLAAINHLDIIKSNHRPTVSPTASSEHLIAKLEQYDLIIELLDAIHDQLASHVDWRDIGTIGRFGTFLQYIALDSSKSRPLLLQRWWKRHGPGLLLSESAQQINGSVTQLKLAMLNLESAVAMVNSIADPEWCLEFGSIFEPDLSSLPVQSFIPTSIRDARKNGTDEPVLTIQKEPISVSTPPNLPTISFDALQGLLNYHSFSIRSNPTGPDAVSQYLVDIDSSNSLPIPVNYSRGLRTTMWRSMHRIKANKTAKLLRIRSSTLEKAEYQYYRRITTSGMLYNQSAGDHTPGSTTQPITKTKRVPQINLKTLPTGFLDPDQLKKLISNESYQKHNLYFADGRLRVGLLPFFWTYGSPPAGYQHSQYVSQSQNGSEQSPNGQWAYEKFRESKGLYDAGMKHGMDGALAG